MKRLTIILTALLLATSAHAQSVIGLREGFEQNLSGRTSFCLGVFSSDFDRALRDQLKATLLRQAALYDFPARDCVLEEPSNVSVHLMIVGSAMSVRTSVSALRYGDLLMPTLWALEGLVVGGTGSVADRAWPMIREQFETLVVAWKDANPSR